jgi:hypothetical protein
MSATQVTRLHRKAMQLSHAADAALGGGEALRLRSMAFEAERAAAEMLYSSLSEEPARSILFRSAAVLALECNDLSEAGRLAAAGLSGRPPGKIADELHDIWERATFGRHLKLRDIVLSDDEFQLALNGRGIGPGIASEHSFLPRYRAAQSLFLRTAERLNGWEFSARVRKETKERFEFFLAAPRAASFAITVRVGRNLSLPGSDAGKIIDEVSECLALYQSGGRDQLEKRIDDAYRKNFDALASEIAPDGVEIELVGLTTFRDGSERTVAITRPRATPTLTRLPTAEIETIQRDDQPHNSALRGTMIYASSVRKGKKKTIKILPPEGSAITVEVPAELMHDVVRPYYEAEVIVTLGKTRQGGFYLVDIVGV